MPYKFNFNPQNKHYRVVEVKLRQAFGFAEREEGFKNVLLRYKSEQDYS